MPKDSPERLRIILKKFEAINGRIKIQDEVPGIPMNFGGPTAQA